MGGHRAANTAIANPLFAIPYSPLTPIRHRVPTDCHVVSVNLKQRTSWRCVFTPSLALAIVADLRHNGTTDGAQGDAGGGEAEVSMKSIALTALLGSLLAFSLHATPAQALFRTYLSANGLDSNDCSQL